MNYKTDSLQGIIDFTTQSAHAVVLFHGNSKILFINAQAEKLLDLSEDTDVPVPDRIFQLVQPQDRDILLAAIKLLPRAPLHNFETIFSAKGSSIPVCISAYALLEKEVTAVFIEDFSKQKDQENYLIEYGTKKNSTLDGVVHFMSGAVTLMRNLSSEAGRFVESGNLKSIQSYLALIDANSMHCLKVIEDLLQEEHGKSPKIQIKDSRINLVEKIGYIIENLRNAYPKRTFDFIRPPADPIVQADEFKVLQIVNNFAFNAIKFSSPQMPVTINIKDLGDRVTVAVMDLGIGIPPQLQPYIFDRNTIAGRVGLSGEKSFGVGLSICKELATLMGCKIWFETQDGRGSSFYLSIPKS